VSVIVLGAPTAARADADLTAITTALENSDYPAAQDLLGKALAAGGNSPETTVELYRLQGVVEGSLGNTQPATDAFLKALALNPKLALPVGTSPKIQKPFEAAQRFYKSSAPLKVKVETRPGSATAPPAVTIVVQSDPLKMVSRARVAVVVDGKPEQMVDGTGTIVLPAGNRLDLRVTVLDTSGNRLVEIGSTDVPIVIVSANAPRVVDGKPVVKVPPKKRADEGPSHERPLYLRWWLWGGAAVAFAGVGSGFGIGALMAKSDLEELNATSTAHSFDDARAVEDTIRTRLLVTNISYGVAIGCGVTAAILFLTKPRSAERASVSVAPAPLRGGGALVIGGEF
jgi:hypothetical protein